MKEKDIERLRDLLKRLRMECCFESLVINLNNDKCVHYTSPEFSENEDKSYNRIYNTLKRKKFTDNEINNLMRIIDDFAYYKSMIYYEYGFKSGVDFCED